MYCRSALGGTMLKARDCPIKLEGDELLVKIFFIFIQNYSDENNLEFHFLFNSSCNSGAIEKGAN